MRLATAGSTCRGVAPHAAGGIEWICHLQKWDSSGSKKKNLDMVEPVLQNQSTMTSETKPEVLYLTKDIAPEARKALEALEQVATVHVYSPESREDLVARFQSEFKNVVAIATTFFSGVAVGSFDKELIDQFPASVKFVCHNGAGYDIIDFDYVTKKGYQMSHTPDAVVPATADTAIYLILGCLRNFGRLERDLREGKWCQATPLARDPEGKVLGILGMGGIGKAIRDKSKVFDFEKIIYHNRSRLPEAEENGAEYVSFEELLAQSDVLNISIPLNKHTHHILNREALQKCKKGVRIVNTARGAVVEEEALADLLESGHIAAVGLDVFEEEPKVHPKLLASPNTVLLPHVGTHTRESRGHMESLVLKNLESAVATGKLLTYIIEQR